jgi:transketolase-like protein
MDDLKQFRQVDSLTPGHPEANHTDGQKHRLLCYYAYIYMRFRDRGHYWTAWPGYIKCRWLGHCAGASRGCL